MVKHRAETLKKWRLIVNDFNQSNLSPKEYSVQSGININTLYMWRSRFGVVSKSRERRSSEKKTFKEVKFTEGIQTDITESSSELELILPNKITIRLNESYSEELLLRTIKLLRGVSC